MPAPIAAPAPVPMPAPIAPAPAPAPAAVAPAPAPAPAGGTVPCTVCGHPNIAGHKFCASCGTVLQSAAPAASISQPMAAASPTHASLTALRADGSDAGTFELPQGSSVIGRDLGGIFGGDSYLSPRHATFKVGGGKLSVKDEHSLNGVYIKIQRDTPTELKPGDVFRIGQEIIRFERLQPPSPSPDGVERLGSPAEGVIGRLSLITGRDSTGNSFVIQSHGIHLGRERGDVQFPEDGYVSGLHCRIAPEAGRIFLTDLGSSNGTYVRFSDERELQSGDVLLMGQQLFRVGL
jgi:pSer/pThr/pTyr-binding forkhead associated (FHA) protein